MENAEVVKELYDIKLRIEKLMNQLQGGSSITPDRVYREYQKLFFQRFGTYCPRSGKDISAIKRMCQTNTIEFLCNALQVYFQMQDDWFQKRLYDLTTFESNLHKVAAAMHNGTEEVLKPISASTKLLREESNEQARISAPNAAT